LRIIASVDIDQFGIPTSLDLKPRHCKRLKPRLYRKKPMRRARITENIDVYKPRLKGQGLQRRRWVSSLPREVGLSVFDIGEEEE